MKKFYFSDLDYDDIVRLEAAKTAEGFVSIFERILSSLYSQDFWARLPVVDDFTFLVKMFSTDDSPFPMHGEGIRFYPSCDAYQKLEKHFQAIERYKSLLKHPHSLCGRWKINRKIGQMDYELSAQELYSAVIYLFVHKGLGTVEEFKRMIAPNE